MENEIMLHQSTELSNEQPVDYTSKLNKALDEVGADEKFLAHGFVDIANSAYTMTPKGEPYPDYPSRLQALKEIRKIRANMPDTQINIQNVFGSAGGGL